MKTKYDPSKKYSWTPNDEFVMTGDQFGTVLNALRAIIGTPEAQRILAAAKANDVIEKMMESAVEKGVVLEMPTSPPQPGLTGQLHVVKD